MYDDLGLEKMRRMSVVVEAMKVKPCQFYQPYKKVEDVKFARDQLVLRNGQTKDSPSGIACTLLGYSRLSEYTNVKLHLDL